jgi:FKBP-type peptidyl-prolyl cis-trans isomerase SlyD
MERMMQAIQDKVVTIHYKLTDRNGELLDSSEGQDPLAYLHGRGNIISGLENALSGKSAGDKLNVTIPPEEAYGVRDEALVRVLSRSAFKDVDELETGMRFQTDTEQGVQIFTVTAIEGDQVTIDGNHPLADEELNFDVEIVAIRNASEEELTHGHVHGPGGHQH